MTQTLVARPSGTLLVLFTLFLAARSASAQCVLEDDSPSVIDRFGHMVDVSGDRLAIGVPGDEGAGGEDSGSVRIHEASGGEWSEVARLMPADGEPYDQFGAILALDGDRMVASVPTRTTAAGLHAGVVYVYERRGGLWRLDAQLEPIQAAALARFGASLALEGDRLVIGAPDSDASALDQAGTVYLFERTTSGWVQAAELAPSSPEAYAMFGSSVALSGDRVLVGAPQESFAEGAGYVFDLGGSGWSEVARLRIPAPVPNDNLGYRVAIDGDLALLSMASISGPAGRVHVFERRGVTWRHETFLESGLDQPFQGFGGSLVLEGDVALIGAHNLAVAGFYGVGGAYRFERRDTSWSRAETYVLPGTLPPSGSGSGSGSAVGWSLDLSSEWIVLGAPSHDQADLAAGAVFVLPRPSFASFECACLPAGPCGQGASLGGCLHSSGVGAVLAYCGSASIAHDDLRLTASHLPAHVPALVAMGGASGSQVFGDGHLCIASGGTGLFRYRLRSSGGDGSLVEGPGIVAYSHAHFPPPGHIRPGDTWHFQVVFRDPHGPCGGGSNATNALGILFAP